MAELTTALGKEVMQSYRSTLQIPSSPSFIDTSLPITPVAIIASAKQPCKSGLTSTTAVNATHVYTVPAGKLWVVRTINGWRGQAASIYIQAFIDNVQTNIKTSQAATTTDLDIQTELALKSGDSVQVSFSTGVSGTLQSGIVYEEYGQ
jgi:hypothetical protein